MKKLPQTKTKITSAERAPYRDLVPQQELFKPTQTGESIALWLRSLTQEKIISMFMSADEKGMYGLSFEAIKHQLDFHNQFGSFDLQRLEADIRESVREHHERVVTELGGE